MRAAGQWLVAVGVVIKGPRRRRLRGGRVKERGETKEKTERKERKENSEKMN